MRKYSLVFVLAAAACSSETTPTASGVFPAEGFTGRALRVEISGDATTWKDGATVDFGAGVTVNSVEVASPTDLFANITVDPMAMPGKNDVTVTSSGKKYTLAKAFELVSPVAITFQGDVAQFGVPNFTLNNLDFENPFDLTTDPATGAFTNLVINAPAGSEFIIGNATQYQVTGQVFIDANGMSGPVSVVSGPSGGTSNVTSVAAAITVMPRTPMAFSGTATGSFMNPGDSAVYGVTATGASILHYTLGASDPNAQPASAILGAGGTWRNDFLGAGHALLGSGSASIVVVNLGGSGYTYTVTGAVEALTAAAEGNDTTNNTPAGVTALTTIPYEQTGGTLSAATDKDYIKLTIGSAQAGKTLHVTTDAGDPNTDTALNITDCSANDGTSYSGGEVDGSLCGFFSCTSLGEDVTSTSTLAAGTYCVKVSAGASFDPTSKNYTLLFWLE